MDKKQAISVLGLCVSQFPRFSTSDRERYPAEIMQGRSVLYHQLSCSDSLELDRLGKEVRGVLSKPIKKTVVKLIESISGG